MIDFSELFQNLVLLLVALAALPWVIYGVSWLTGRAWYAGRMSAIRSAFHLGSNKRWSKRERSRDSSTNSGRRSP